MATIKMIGGVETRVYKESEQRADRLESEVPSGRVKCRWQTVNGMSPCVGFVGVLPLGCMLLQVVDYEGYGYQHILCAGEKPTFCPLKKEEVSQ